MQRGLLLGGKLKSKKQERASEAIVNLQKHMAQKLAATQLPWSFCCFSKLAWGAYSSPEDPWSPQPPLQPSWCLKKNYFQFRNWNWKWVCLLFTVLWRHGNGCRGVTGSLVIALLPTQCATACRVLKVLLGEPLDSEKEKGLTWRKGIRSMILQKLWFWESRIQGLIELLQDV